MRALAIPYCIRPKRIIGSFFCGWTMAYFFNVDPITNHFFRGFRKIYSVQNFQIRFGLNFKVRLVIALIAASAAGRGQPQGFNWRSIGESRPAQMVYGVGDQQNERYRS